MLPKVRSPHCGLVVNRSHIDGAVRLDVVTIIASDDGEFIGDTLVAMHVPVNEMSSLVAGWRQPERRTLEVEGVTIEVIPPNDMPESWRWGMAHIQVRYGDVVVFMPYQRPDTLTVFRTQIGEAAHS